MDQEILAPKAKDGQPWDVAIVGSGPSGLTAAIYTTRGAASTVIFGGDSWGGQLMITTAVDNFPALPGIQGPELMTKMKDHALKFGAEFIQSKVSSVDLSKKPFELAVDGQKYLARSVIIATGAATVWLDAPGISKLIGRGVSSCAPCDAPFFKDKSVVVVGGGDSAMEEAHVLTKYASSVTIVHRRDSFRASAAMQKKVLENPKIKVLWNTEVVEAVGGDKLEKLILKNNKDSKNYELAADGVFIAIGHKPESGIFKGFIETDERGYIVVKEGTKTNIPGIFVAGDVHDHKYKQAITAAGFGCMAAMDTLEYLEGEGK